LETAIVFNADTNVKIFLGWGDTITYTN